MKGKLIKRWKYNDVDIQCGTEVIIIKGMESDASGVLNAPYGMCYLCELNSIMTYIPATHISITEWSNVDWEQRRYEIAKSVMCSSSGSPESMADYAVRCADALIQELKKQ